MTQYTNGAVVQINSDGTFNQTIVTGLSSAASIAVNPKNGHLLVGSGDASQTWIADVNPSTKTASTFLTLPHGFGSAVGPATDGVTLYVAAYNISEGGEHILGYHLSDKKQPFFDSGFLLGAAGVAVGGGTRKGYLFVNDIYGQVFQIDLNTQVITLIATRGSRGARLTVDPDGSLLIFQSDRIMRLTFPQGDSFETASVAIRPSIVAGSNDATGTITLSTPAPVNLAVNLSSSDPTLAQPVDGHGNSISSVTVPAGSLTTTFSIATAPVTDRAPAYITATLNYVSSSAKLTVRPIGVKSLVLQPSTIKGGNTVTGTVTLEGAAAPGDITVTFTSTDPAVVPTPASLVIRAGQKSATFTVTTTAVTANTTVTLSATANNVPGSAKLVVMP